jgi:hypothetical protein
MCAERSESSHGDAQAGRAMEGRGSQAQGYFCTIIQGKRAKLTGQ